MNVAAAVLACLCLAACSNDNAIPANWQVIDEPQLHYSVAFPPRCTITRASDIEPQRRVDAVCPGSRWITIYVVEIKGVVDEQDLSVDADKQWAAGYALTDTIYKPEIPEALRWVAEDQIWGITKVYEKTESVRVIATEARGRFAYYLLMDGDSAFKNDFVQIAKSFKSQFSTKEAGYTVLFYFTAGTLAWLLGLAGLWLRQSRIKRRVLKQIREYQNIDVASVDRALRPEMLKLIVIPIYSVCLYIGGVLFINHFFDQLSLVIFVVVGPFLPILGYFGIVRDPPEDLPEHL